MTAKVHRLGPGSLKLGEIGEEVEFGLGIESASIEPKTEKGVPVLTGDPAPGVTTWTLKGNLYQSYDTKSFIVWCHHHAGETVPFVFRPSHDHELSVRGRVVVSRISIGGKVKENNTSDFEFEGVDDYELDLIPEEATGGPGLGPEALRWADGETADR